MSDELELTYATGLEVQARSQWAYARRRFVRHRLAMVSLVVLFIVLGAGAAADWVAPYAYDEIDLENSGVGPTLENHHYFGTDVLGRDYFSRVVYGIQTSERVAFLVAGLSTLIGVLVGAFAGYYGRWADNLLMRLTDLVLTLPGLAVLLTLSAFLGNGSPYRVAVILALLFWTRWRGSSAARSSPCARRSTSRLRVRPGPATHESCSVTSSRTRSGRSSSTPR